MECEKGCGWSFPDWTETLLPTSDGNFHLCWLWLDFKRFPDLTLRHPVLLLSFYEKHFWDLRIHVVRINVHYVSVHISSHNHGKDRMINGDKWIIIRRKINWTL